MESTGEFSTSNLVWYPFKEVLIVAQCGLGGGGLNSRDEQESVTYCSVTQQPEVLRSNGVDRRIQRRKLGENLSFLSFKFCNIQLAQFNTIWREMYLTDWRAEPTLSRARLAGLKSLARLNANPASQ